MKRWFAIVILLVVVLTPGCVSSAVKEQVQKSAAAHDTYAALVESTLDGTIKPQDGTPVTMADLAATPKPVLELLANVTRGLYLSRRAWHQAAFALEVGPDPATLKLDPPSLLPPAKDK